WFHTMSNPSLKTNAIHLSAMTASVLWASAFLGGKYALSYLYPLRLAGIRLLLATLIVLIYMRRNPFEGLRGHYKSIIRLSIFQTIIVFSAFNLGLNLVPGSFGAVIIGSSPAVSSFVAVLMLPEERLNFRKLSGLAIGLAGIALLTVVDEPWKGPGSLHILGALLLMSCNFSTAYGSIIIKKHLSHVPSLSVNFVQSLFGGIVVLLLSYIFEPIHQAPFSFPLAGSVLFLAFITATAVSLWLRIVADANARISVISLWKFLIPSLGAVLSWLFMPDDKPSLATLFGIFAIVLSIGLTVAAPASVRAKASSIRDNRMHEEDNHDMLPTTGEQQI
ncbi:MAG TPA: hypothetical protein DIW48_00715, partial [Sphaerochaeta sp.]|nr:hypothetical protein [Sphaerochaeta sp.]